MKILGRKNYGSVPHISGSRIGKTDKYISKGQSDIATKQLRDHHDLVIITEKLDGCNVGIAKVNGVIYPLTRSGNLACTSQYKHHQMFFDWTMKRADKFASLLNEGERLVGEWLALAHGTKYLILSDEEVFRAFDLMVEDKRATYEEFMNRVAGKVETMPLLSYGPPRTPEWLQDHFPISGAGAEQVEGYVFRIERKGQFDFIAKFVRQDYEAGKYLPEVSGQDAIWNWRK